MSPRIRISQLLLKAPKGRQQAGAARLLPPLRGFSELVVDPFTWGSRPRLHAVAHFGAEIRGLGLVIPCRALNGRAEDS